VANGNEWTYGSRGPFASQAELDAVDPIDVRGVTWMFCALVNNDQSALNAGTLLNALVAAEEGGPFSAIRALGTTSVVINVGAAGSLHPPTCPAGFLKPGGTINAADLNKAMFLWFGRR
jgi:hypothetical protein